MTIAAKAGSAAIDPNAKLMQQRADFKVAWRAASRGDSVTLAPYLETLKDYPLYPYLRYAYLEATLDKQPDILVEQWLDENQALPIAAELRQEWVISLARRQDWDAVLANERYEVTLAQRCAVVSAHVLGGNSVASWSAAAQRLWLTPNVPLQVCQPLFDHLEAHGLITMDMRHKRVEAALIGRDFVTAAALAPTLNVDDRAWANQWLAMAVDPAKVLRGIQVPDEPRYQEMLLAGVKLLARNDPDEARLRWAEISHDYHFGHDESRNMRTLLAMQQAWHLTPDALADLNNVHDSVDPQIPEWRARLALRAGDWKEALKDIGSLRDRNQTEWRYWRARSLEELGQHDAARSIYKQLARTPDYYGFLSADRLDLDYRIVEQASKPSDGTIGKLEAQPGFIRARELVYAGLYPQADAEWGMATRRLSTASRCQAALMAQRWGWYARVIPTLANGGCWQDLSLIYPIAFKDTLAPAAKRLALDLSWIYGLIRQESVFKPNAVSNVGALGLMQLMPDTGRKVSARIGLTLDSPRQLLDPDTNLTVGSNYLSSLLQHFSGSEPLATAAYNAGEQRVNDWRPDTGALAADVWIDTIPYTETRNYVHRVMAHTVMFDWRLNGTPERLSDRIGEVTASAPVPAPAVATVAVMAKISRPEPR
ncbi:MAG TPA: transglycosylase SLT domain-containing protein [Gammaproteobacteria bacterium]